MLITALFSALPTVAGDGWIHLLPSGTFKGVDGRGPYTATNLEAIIRDSMVAGKLPVDEAHATDYGADKGTPAPARGWIVAMEARQDGVWGKVEWTPSGDKLVNEEHAYKGISPVFERTAAGQVTRILRAGLTNVPNLPQLAALHSQQETTMDLAKLRAALGLPETADEAAILKAAGELRTEVATHNSNLTAIITAGGLKATTPEGVVTELQAMRAAAVKPEAVLELQTKLSTMEAERAQEKAVAFVDGAIRAGKPINALRDHYLALHKQDAAGTEKMINALPSINAGGTKIELNAGGGPDGDDLTDTDKMACQRMGIKEDEFKKTKAARRQAAA